MTLAEKLLASRQARIEKEVERSAPKGWAAGRTQSDGADTVTTRPYSSEQDVKKRQLLLDNGYNPDRYRIVGNIRQTSWTAYLPEEYRRNSEEGEAVEDAFTFQAKAYRFQVAEALDGELGVDELIEAVNRADPFPWHPRRHMMGVEPGAMSQEVLDHLKEASPHVVTTEPTVTPIPVHVVLNHDLPYVVAVGDLQIGKQENNTEEFIARYLDLMQRAAEPLVLMTEQGQMMEHVHLAFLGDCIEGGNSQGGKLRWRTTLTMTEQVRVLRRLMLAAIELFAPLTRRLTVVSVPGNHDEAASRDLQTREDDSWAVEALNMVADAIEYNEQAFGHVECYVPGPDEHAVVLRIGTINVAHIHGHQHRVGQHFKWWAGQAFGRQDVGQADLLLQGHEHHMQFDEDGTRKWLCVPAMESESIWWKTKTGTGGSPGLVTFQLDGRAVLNLSKLEPKEVAA